MGLFLRDLLADSVFTGLLSKAWAKGLNTTTGIRKEGVFLPLFLRLFSPLLSKKALLFRYGKM
jgi:hypothetical protein